MHAVARRCFFLLVTQLTIQNFILTLLSLPISSYALVMTSGARTITSTDMLTYLPPSRSCTLTLSCCISTSHTLLSSATMSDTNASLGDSVVLPTTCTATPAGTLCVSRGGGASTVCWKLLASVTAADAFVGVLLIVPSDKSCLQACRCPYPQPLEIFTSCNCNSGTGSLCTAINEGAGFDHYGTDCDNDGANWGCKNMVVWLIHCLSASQAKDMLM